MSPCVERFHHRGWSGEGSPSDLPAVSTHPWSAGRASVDGHFAWSREGNTRRGKAQLLGISKRQFHLRRLFIHTRAGWMDACALVQVT